VYNNTYGVPAGVDLSKLGPQILLVTTKQNVATVAAFTSANTEMDMHSFSIPFDLTFDITNRIQGRVSFGPTFNLFDSEVTTETFYQLIENEPLKLARNDSDRIVYKSPYNGGVRGIGGAKPGANPISGNSSGSTFNAGNNQPEGNANNAGGGKGSSGGKSRDLPGKRLARTTDRDSAQQFELGAFGQATVSLDLDAAKRWFVEAYARYDYVPSFALQTGGASVNIDASSWGAGIGLGFRF
jgi:hypothetical protein